MGVLFDLLFDSQPYLIINVKTEEVICGRVFNEYDGENKSDISSRWYKVGFAQSASNMIWQFLKSEAQTLCEELNKKWGLGWRYVHASQAESLGIKL